MENSLNDEMRAVQCASYPEIFSKFRELSARYGGLSSEQLISAFSRASGGYGANPYVQNRRVKQVSSLPGNYTKDQVADMIRSPDGNEMPLRQVGHALEDTAYPIYQMRRLYQDMLTYHCYFAPSFAAKEDTKRDDFWREWRLLERLRDKLNPGAAAHEICGQTMVEGKVFYYPRVDLDKSHGKVNHAFLQQLPSDYVKIVGFNNHSQYTLAFNMMYFMLPGTTPAQFGDLFRQYWDDFADVVEAPPKGTGKTTVFASKPKIRMERLRARQGRSGGEAPEVYYQNGKWFYWVTLPVDQVFTFEADDVTRNAVSPFTGLFIDMIQLAQLEQIQLELIQNPLVSILHGEIPYFDGKDGANTSDQYKLSDAGRRLFQALWYQMLQESNTSGIGIYMAPLRDMKLETLSEAPSAMDIVSKGYQDTMAKAGLGGIIPTNGDPKAGLAQISSQVESQFAKGIYRDMTRMMDVLLERFHLRYDWKFRMFGTIFDDKETEEKAMKGMEHGILSDTLTYLAIRGRSIFEDLAVSDAIIESGLMDKRLPLISSYNATQDKSGLPPQAAHDQNPGGRPSSEGVATSDGQENDIDAGV